MQPVARCNERGLSSAWVLVVLAMLASLITYAASVTRTAQVDATRQLAASRARQAALAGIDWARFHIANAAPAMCATPRNLTMPLSTGAITVTVHCPQTLHSEGGTPVRTYAITATACQPSSTGSCPDTAATGDYVQQQASAIAWR